MIDAPKTIDEARAYRYGFWAGNPKGNKYHEGNCAYDVFPSNGWYSYQCTRKKGHGPSELYCKQHAKKVKV